MMVRRPHLLHPFGNALGNSIVSNRIDAEQTKRNAMQASDALAQQVDARLNAGPSADGLLDTLGRIDQEVADSIADDFGGNLYVMSQEQEQLARIAADKTANAIFKYNAMSAQTQKDIAAIEQRSRQSAQARAEQWDIRQARQQQKLIDFRMTNPVYRAPAPLFDYDATVRVSKFTNQIPSVLTFDHKDPSLLLHNARSVASILADKQKVAVLKKLGLDMENLRRTYVAGLLSEDVYLNYNDSDNLDTINSMKQALGAFGVSRLDEAALKELGIKGSRLVNEDSGYYSALYHDKTRDTYMLANRGTEDLFKDGTADFVNSYGFVSKQYQYATDLAVQLSRNGDLRGKLSFTGHSLGGGLASAQAARVGASAITFNAAGVSRSVADKLGISLSDSNRGRIQANYLQGDIVSVSQDHWGFDIAAFGTTPIKYGVGLSGLVTGRIGLKDFDFTPGYVPQAFGTRVQLPPGNNDWNSLTRHSQTAVLQTLSQQIYRFGGGK